MQVLPVLVAGALSAQMAKTRPTYLVVEQPELHLHPAAHAPLAKFFCDIASGERAPRIIIETHSENFLFGVQLAVANDAPSHERVLINWIRQDAEGLSTVTRMPMDAEGRPDGWPRDVFTEEAALAKMLFEARRRRKARP
jgi:predicted ATPase